MLLRKTIQKTKHFFHKTLHNIKSFLFGGYQKLPKILHFNPFSGTSSRTNPNIQKYNNCYRNFSEPWDIGHDDQAREPEEECIVAVDEPEGEEDASRPRARFINNAGQSIEVNKQQAGGNGAERKGLCSKSAHKEGTGNVLAQKMKELEMMDENDADHVVDIEEVLECYSQLTSPVYLDIVDKFFMDMYSESFLPIPLPSVCINNSKRRLGPLKF